ncbi:thermonuclease family protein [Prevotella sp. 10(H)]|uniref:thermonuclease family protein n=1 Tax=Prevotella sp. 10(H) TaxID=1158294 RepID=UPI0004A78660|nr:thermonuclease family protein [Prevotella sp. 10(H)]
MKKIISIITLILSTATLIYTGVDIFEDDEYLTGKVVKVADGDTFTLLTNSNEKIRIRLYGIDAPENGQDYGSKSRQYLNDLCYGKQVRVQKIDTDHYGRTLGVVFVDGINVNEELVRQGLAWYYREYADDPFLEALELSARDKRINIWSMKNPVPPHEFRRNKRKK